MLGRHVPIFVVALGASLVLHAGLYTGTRRVHVTASDLTAARSARPAERSATVALLGPDATVKDDSADLVAALPKELTSPEPPEEPEPPKVEPPPPDPVPPPKPDVEKFPDRIGKNDGEGIGTHAADGDKPLKAPKADNDQPFLSRDPRGAGPIADPSRSAAPPGQNGAGGKPGGPASPVEVVAVVPPPPRPPLPRVEDAEPGPMRPGPIDVRVAAREDGIETPAVKIDESAKVRGPLTQERPGSALGLATAEPSHQLVRPDGLFAPPPAARPAMSPPPAPLPMRAPELPPPPPPAPDLPPVAAVRLTPVQPRAAGQGDGGRPGPTTPAADPAQESESEVDAFSKIEAFVRRDGRVDPQFGREVKTVRPKMLTVSLVDAVLGARQVTLKVRIGPDGKVTSAKVHKSSGSTAVDQPCVVAMYDWWFEPLRDKAGRPIPDTILFTINFR